MVGVGEGRVTRVTSLTPVFEPDIASRDRPGARREQTQVERRPSVRTRRRQTGRKRDGECQTTSKIKVMDDNQRRWRAKRTHSHRGETEDGISQRMEDSDLLLNLLGSPTETVLAVKQDLPPNTRPDGPRSLDPDQTRNKQNESEGPTLGMPGVAFGALQTTPGQRGRPRRGQTRIDQGRSETL